ncbi:MAG TPA: hypothetical protein VIS48_11785 [Candidatus Kryptonia bacterium]
MEIVVLNYSSVRIGIKGTVMGNSKLSFVVMIISITLAGCGGSEVLLRPNYSVKEIVDHKVTDVSVKITKVIDRRKSDPRTVGTARVGMMNTLVPYHLSVPLPEFVKGIYDSLFVDSVGPTIHAAVYIDSFRVREEQSLFNETGVMNARIYFGIPVSRDSVVYIETSSEQRAHSGIDVTDMLEPLIYKSTVDCALQFADHVRLTGRASLLASCDSSTSAIVENSTLPPSNAVEVGWKRPPFRLHSDAGFSYGAGGKITSDVRLFWNMMTQKDSSSIMMGYGLNLDILNVTNQSAMIKGSIVGFGGNYVFRALLSGRKVSPFIGLEGTLIFGNESIDYGTSTETSFFFGPLLRQTIGISINRQFFIEAGIFEIVLAGSEMLPNDVGFNAGMSFGI